MMRKIRNKIKDLLKAEKSTVCEAEEAECPLIPAGTVNFGDFKNVEPIAREFGAERGSPIDRYYVEKFLSENAGSITGKVLEFEDNAYTLKYGNKKVTQSEIIHIDATNSMATIIGDISQEDLIRPETFDCVICTQMLFMVYDIRKAVQALYRILKPGGTLLLTNPMIAQICDNEGAPWNDYWRFTKAAAERLFGDVFGTKNVNVCSYGNALTAIGILQGLVQEDLTEEQMEIQDKEYQVIVAVQARKKLE